MAIGLEITSSNLLSGDNILVAGLGWCWVGDRRERKGRYLARKTGSDVKLIW